MLLSFSIEAVSREIYAASALRYFQNCSSGACPPMLTRDRREALRLLIKDAFANIMLRLLPHIASTNLSTLAETDDILTVEVNFPAGFASERAEVVRQAVEHAIAMDAMHLCYMGHDDELSMRHAELSAQSVARVKELLRAYPSDLVAIVSHWL